MEFSGAKLVCLVGGRLLTLLRDDRPDIVFPGHWDLPGGGREGDEIAEACVLRETHEEFGLRIDPAALIWRARYASVTLPGTTSWWFGARLPAAVEARIELGDEGQGWALMTPRAWLGHPLAVPHFKDRVRDGLAGMGVAGAG